MMLIATRTGAERLFGIQVDKHGSVCCCCIVVGRNNITHSFAGVGGERERREGVGEEMRGKGREKRRERERERERGCDFSQRHEACQDSSPLKEDIFVLGRNILEPFLRARGRDFSQRHEACQFKTRRHSKKTFLFFDATTHTNLFSERQRQRKRERERERLAVAISDKDARPAKTPSPPQKRNLYLPLLSDFSDQVSIVHRWLGHGTAPGSTDDDQ